MAMAFWDNMAMYRKVTIIAVTVTSVIAALIAIANALQAGEPHWIATRSFVREMVLEAQSKSAIEQQKLQSGLLQTEVQVLQSRIDSIKSKISDRQLLLQKQEGPAEYRQLVQEQINNSQESLQRLNDQLQALRKQLGD